MKYTLILTALLLGCTSAEVPPVVEEPPTTPEEEQEEPTEEEQVQREEAAERAEVANERKEVSLDALEEELSPWIDLWQSFLPDFSLQDLQGGSATPIEPSFTDSLENHESILDVQAELPFPIIFSAEDGLTHVYVSPPGSPDSEVALIKPEDNLYERVLFCGTACSWDGAFWISNSQLAVTGYAELHPQGEERCIAEGICTIVPTLHIFDLTQNTVIQYTGPEIDAAFFYDIDTPPEPEL